MPNPNPRRQREARAKLRQAIEQGANAFLIHYACQKLTSCVTPRIVSIAVRNLLDGETITFSIHQEAEASGRSGPLGEAVLDRLELSLLGKLSAFFGMHQRSLFLHWNMKDDVYGFAVIERRLSQLSGSKATLPVHRSQKINLAALMALIYGDDYAPRPHFESLAELNGFDLEGYLPGASEPEAFARGDYKAVMMSNIRKVALMAEIARCACDGSLRTTKNAWQLNAGKVREAYESILENPVYGIGIAMATVGTTAFKVVSWIMERGGPSP